MNLFKVNPIDRLRGEHRSTNENLCIKLDDTISKENLKMDES